jgi:NADP-dependent 3-hydroxy acid dehydrogenase YdfG
LHAATAKEEADMKRSLSGKVVVLTGASSGIGRVAAQIFADQGAKLVLAARDGDALNEVVRLCQERGGQALAVPTDVRDEAQMLALRDTAVSRFGAIDVWVNDAAVYMLGTVERVPTEQVRALFETNVIGVVNGAKAALAQFRKQGHGTLINVGSVAGKVSYAQASAYCASKHAVHAITEALRQELTGTDIHACVVGFATVDTPLFQHSANYTGKRIKAMKPVYSVERAAMAIVKSAKRPKRQRFVGAAPRMMTFMQRFMPWLYERMQPKMVAKGHLEQESAPSGPGNMEKPLPPHSDDGGWKEPAVPRLST